MQSLATTKTSLDFILQGGAVTIAVALMLLLMSVVTWYFVVVKTIQIVKVKKIIRKDIQAFNTSPTIETMLEKFHPASPVAKLALAAVESDLHFKAHKPDAAAGSHGDFILKNMRRSFAQEQTQLDAGLTVLASVGSVAPFVGLFGTVWGIYHALASISASGQATIDKVAGPVGEALIMTAIGLAVAIPAVLAYNTFLKYNRGVMASLESIGQDIHTLLTTGAALLPAKIESSNLLSASTVQEAVQYAK